MNTDFRRLLPGKTSRSLLAAGALATVTVMAHADGFSPTWVESGMETRMRGYRPMTVMLTNNAPEALKRGPEGLAAPLYGTFQTGPEKGRLAHAVIAIARDNRPVSLYVDVNADGEISKDEVFEWAGQEFKKPDGSIATNYFSGATVKLTREGKRGLVKFYFPTKDAGEAAGTPSYLVYYTDCGVIGQIEIGGRTLNAALSDPGATGEFQLSAGWHTPLAWVDVDGDGKPGGKEVFQVGHPFEVAGKWWAITNLTTSGSFQVAAAMKPSVPKKSGPDLSPGQKAPPFTAKQMDGKTVKFPADYKGKVVLVDFWATWCGPCVAEIPNVVKNYEQYHSQGLEVLGISLDREGAEETITKFTESKKMPWPQVYDGKFWSAEVAKLYGISGIPHMLLVDGDAGLILADQDIRGEKLSEAIQKALAGKKK